jgi:nuclear pore complex protein Nup107
LNTKPHFSLYASTVRFYAHLCLFLRLVGQTQTVPPLAAEAILDAYVGLLEPGGNADLVALYVGALSDTAVTRYALYLSSKRLLPPLYHVVTAFQKIFILIPNHMSAD